MIKKQILKLIEKRALIIDGAMGTQLQTYGVPAEAWIDDKGVDQEGCNELLNATAPEILEKIHNAYALSGADLIKTNTFGTMPWVLDEYNMGERCYELSKLGCEHVKKICDKYSTADKPRFVLASIGPGTKLPSLGHIDYDTMYDGYKETAIGLVDGGADIFLLETCQDPLQIKAAIHALNDTAPQIPIMVSVTIELSGSMLIGTDAQTITTILEPFDVLSLGFNCGTGPEQVKKHLEVLSEHSNKYLSIHANAGLPQNKGGYTFYPMGPDEFATIQKTFLDFDGVSFLGGCCGTTPQHIKALVDTVQNIQPKKPTGNHPTSLASLFQTVELKQSPSPLLIGERSNATGSKAFRELLKAEDFEGTLTVGQQQVRAGAHIIDVSVGFAGRDETKDMDQVVSLYAQKISLPLMPDSTQIPALEKALKLIGGKPILNSVNLEDGIERFDEICALAKKFGTSLVCLVIDEVAMAKTKDDKVRIAQRIYQRAVNHHGLNPEDLVFDMLVFTIGSGDEEYHTAGIETIEAIKEFTSMHPEISTTLGLSNISFGLNTHARVYLNSVFLHYCVEAGLSSAIVNVKHLIPINKMSKEDLKACEDLLFNNRVDGDPLFAFIEHFSEVEAVEQQTDEEYEKLTPKEKVIQLLKDGDKERLIPLALTLKDEIAPEIIVNEWLIDGMKEIGLLFGDGIMQLPFVLQSAETMKATVDQLNPYLPKIQKESETTLVLGTVKGDVHDVGKNLVDIILSNNGFKVVNIGIKANIESFISEAKKHNANAIGMSGLLVKSTNEMKANLEVLQEQNIKLPVMLGGAALTKAFVDDFCRPIYDGPIFYARDAFDGVIAMQRIEKQLETGDALDTAMAADLVVVDDSIEKEEKIEFNSDIHTPLLLENKHNFTPPFWGRRDMSKDFDPSLAFQWINHRVLFRQRWGYKKGKMTPEEFREHEKNVVQSIYESLKEEFLDKNVFDPIVLYGYFPCKSNDTILEIYDNEKENIIAKFDFPRQGKSPHRCLADYFNSYEKDQFDVVGFTFVSSGLKITDFEKEIYDKGEFAKYYNVHGLGVELAEALAEVVHKQIRLDLNIASNEKPTLKDVVMKGYQGCRYSPGYAACPDLAMNRQIFDLLNPEEFGVELSETFQIHPEQSTVAIVVPNSEAKYFNI
ncbi:MAG: methionine synthase [Campylobacterota bacterium]|nr:methionine synthase [Campylobacterota bacterium]